MAEEEVRAEPLSELTRGRLKDVRRALLRLHKTLLDAERVSYERGRGSVGGSGEFLQLVINDPWFAWLRPLSEIVVRIDELLEPAEPASEGEAQAVLRQSQELVRPAGGGGEFERHAGLAAPGEDVGREEGPEARGREQVEALGRRAQAAGADDEAAPVRVVGLNDAVFDAEPPGEFQSGRLLGDERVRPAFEQEALAPPRPHRPAQAARRFEQQDLGRRFQLQQPVRRREAADAAADDDHPPASLGTFSHRSSIPTI